MRYAHFSQQERQHYKIVLLVNSIRKDEIEAAYIKPFGLDPEEVLAIELSYEPGKKKPSAGYIKEYLEKELAPILKDVAAQYVVCTDSEYMKILAKVSKIEANLGYVLPSPWGKFNVLYAPSYRAIFYDPPKVKAKIFQAMEALNDHRAGIYKDPGNGIIHYEEYPETLEEIEQALIRLLEMDKPLAIDIEAFSLKHVDAGIATIAFAWSKHEGIAFAVDYEPSVVLDEKGKPLLYGKQGRNQEVRRMLKQFFILLQQKAVYHNISYDVYNLIYQLFMEDLLDQEGLLMGLDVMLRNWDDTKLITYLATNSCAGNKLSLKDQAQEFAGNYAMGENIKDVRKIPLPQLLTYNLVDCLSTWHVYEKHHGTMMKDLQQEIYEGLFKDAIKDIIQMQLSGMPINMERTIEVKGILEADEKKALGIMHGSMAVQQYTYQLRERIAAAKNEKYVKKRVTAAELDDEFNPNSPLQLQELLFDMLGLPILGYTDTKQPSTDNDTIKALLNHTDNADTIRFLKALIDFKDVNKILTSFIPAMLRASKGKDGWHYMFGNFNLGGTVSGRLSSSDPNLQNLPANSRYAKLIKSCFQAPPGWLFTGLDYASLEDRISALTTKDPNKLKVYTDGYDGHSMRAVAYFGDQMPDIDPNDVASVNSVAEKYKPLRQDSKAPTFALTYQGTYITLMTNCGFSEEKAKMVEKRYHDLYVVSDTWVENKLAEASKRGYVITAFGLRLRTPLLHQVILGTSRTPYQASAEGRTAGNALGQGWCMLTNRSASEFMKRVRAEDYRMHIRPCAHIHDAQYYMVRDDIKIVAYVNEHLVKAVQWQDHPDIEHDEVKLGGEYSIFYPTWNDEIVIPNGANENDIPGIVDAAIEKRKKKTA